VRCSCWNNGHLSSSSNYFVMKVGGGNYRGLNNTSTQLYPQTLNTSLDPWVCKQNNPKTTHLNIRQTLKDWSIHTMTERRPLVFMEWIQSFNHRLPGRRNTHASWGSASPWGSRPGSLSTTLSVSPSGSCSGISLRDLRQTTTYVFPSSMILLANIICRNEPLHLAQDPAQDLPRWHCLHSPSGSRSGSQHSSQRCCLHLLSISLNDAVCISPCISLDDCRPHR